MNEEDFADWFADSERKRYEDWLSQKIRFSVRGRNWIYEFKWLIIWGGREQVFASELVTMWTV